MDKNVAKKPTGLSRAATGVAAAMVIGGLAPAPALAQPAGIPDFGPNVKIFDQSTPVAQINQHLMSISGESEFSSNRHAVFFMPGAYGSAAGANDPATATGIVNSEVGYYTSIHGLGASPTDVVINGALHVEPVQTAEGSDSLTRFWR